VNKECTSQPFNVSTILSIEADEIIVTTRETTFIRNNTAYSVALWTQAQILSVQDNFIIVTQGPRNVRCLYMEFINTTTLFFSQIINSQNPAACPSASTTTSCFKNTNAEYIADTGYFTFNVTQPPAACEAKTGCDSYQDIRAYPATACPCDRCNDGWHLYDGGCVTECPIGYNSVNLAGVIICSTIVSANQFTATPTNTTIRDVDLTSTASVNFHAITDSSTAIAVANYGLVIGLCIFVIL